MPVDAKDAKYLHVKELAAEWRQHPATIYRKVHSGAIPSVRLGAGRAAIRIPVDELEKFYPTGKENHERG